MHKTERMTKGISNGMKGFFVFGIIFIAVAGIALSIYLQVNRENMLGVNSFDECEFLGYPVMESYPRQCQGPDGRTFTEYIGNELEKAELIRVNSPRPGDPISSPLVVYGEARGTWFFEASFPIKLFDGNGKEIAIAIAQAKGEWMTQDFVPFEATLEFANPVTKKALWYSRKIIPRVCQSTTIVL